MIPDSSEKKVQKIKVRFDQGLVHHLKTNVGVGHLGIGRAGAVV
jgi:hypothetical protein